MIANKYIIEAKLTQGKFGKLYKGKHKRTNEIVAIKCEVLDSPIKMIKQEATLLNYLHGKNCRNTPFVYYYGIFQEFSVLVMPFYDCTLQHYIYTHSTNKETIALTIKMIGLLEEIHDLGVIHRDIKPENFMLKNEELYLIDFGLSTIYVNEDMTPIDPKNESCFIIGTPKFISLHVHNGKDPSRRDDVISVMYIYFYMINGLSLPWENVNHVSDDYEQHHILHPKNVERKKRKEQFHEATYDDTKEKIIFSHLYNIKFQERPHYQWIIDVLQDQ